MNKPKYIIRNDLTGLTWPAVSRFEAWFFASNFGVYSIFRQGGSGTPLHIFEII